LFALQATRVTLSVDPLVVAAGVFRHVLEVPGPGELFEHADGGDDVVIDDFALGGVQGAGADGQILDLIGAEESVLLSVRPLPAVGFGDLPDAGDGCLVHFFAADIGAAQVLAITHQLPAEGLVVALRRLGWLAIRHAAPFGDFGITPDNFPAGIDQLDAIEQRLQLGGLVDDVHRRRHLAAIVQQRGDAQFVAVLVGQFEVGERPFGGGVGGLGQHHGQFRHALAVAAGVGRLFVDGEVDQPDEGFEQHFQLLHQLPVAERHGSLRGERFGQPLVGRRKGDDLAGDRVEGIDQLQHPDHLTLVILHRYGQEGL